jgi:RNA polymerase sigma factor (sigma-70 family)
VVERSAELRGLIEKYAHVIRAAVARVVRGTRPDLGDEVVQRVAEALWKRLQSAQAIDEPSSYLYRCAIRETIRLIKQDYGDVELETVQVVSTAPSPEHELEGRRLAAEVDSVLGGMAPDRAQAVRAHLAGFTVEEIMQTHAWPYQKARNLIARGMADLRAALSARGFP